ncbi:DivIVA domain-containing protein [Amnibacterium sp. CER49]|uniref:DivIVA domain-containing protein n=1 Tax=Amnibacterium sp. CER49 TaxID=3039161 RepID=UPI00244A2E82|nr:DivIVA domain-containing protein [Amnibacterium sp. CER49]MDH2442720.1 DivIVA domain-containing protein [Amnibacterium sp. CER49]
MSTTFPRTRGRRLGYDPDEVDTFLSDARAAFDDKRQQAPLTAADIRRTAFSMQRGGYATAAVDAALERLEDAFATRERDRARRSAGERAYYANTRTIAKEIIGRLDRPEGHRFDRTGLLQVGYAVKDVDAFAEQARAYFEEGARFAVDDVRGVAFRPARNGYREAQVDLLIDALVEVMLAVR